MNKEPLSDHRINGASYFYQDNICLPFTTSPRRLRQRFVGFGSGHGRLTDETCFSEPEDEAHSDSSRTETHVSGHSITCAPACGCAALTVADGRCGDAHVHRDIVDKWQLRGVMFPIIMVQNSRQSTIHVS